MQSKNSVSIGICHRENNDLDIVFGARWDCTFCLHLITCDCLGMGMYHIRQSFSFNYCTDFNKECAQKYKTLVYYSCHLLLCFQKLDFSQSFRHEMHSVQTSNARTLLKATIDSFGFILFTWPDSPAATWCTCNQARWARPLLEHHPWGFDSQLR